MSPHERRFVRRVFKLGRGYPLGREEERRLRVVFNGNAVRVVDDPQSLPVFELRYVGDFVTGFVSTRKDRFPDRFDEANIPAAIRAAKRLKDEEEERERTWK